MNKMKVRFFDKKTKKNAKLDSSGKEFLINEDLEVVEYIE